MNNEIIAIHENIYKILPPYKDIYTTVCAVKTPAGAVLFDAASFDADAEGYILPMLEALNIGKADLKYIFISHNHKDHAGALAELLKHFPDVTVLSRSAALKEKLVGYKVYAPEDGEAVLEVLRAVTIPGHTEDCMALLDTRTGTLITGDCLQVYGVFGSQDWGANIGFPVEYMEAIEKARGLGVREIYTAHDYHPCGNCAKGDAQISRMLDGCIEPLNRICNLIKENPSKSDEDIRLLYNAVKEVPPISTRVVGAVRKAILQGKM